MADPSRGAPPRFNPFAQEFVPRFGNAGPMPQQQQPVFQPRPGMVVPPQQFVPQQFVQMQPPQMGMQGYQHPVAAVPPFQQVPQVVPQQQQQQVQANQHHQPPPPQATAPAAEQPKQVPPLQQEPQENQPQPQGQAPAPAPVPAQPSVAEASEAVEKMKIKDNNVVKKPVVAVVEPAKNEKEEEIGDWERSSSPTNDNSSANRRVNEPAPAEPTKSSKQAVVEEKKMPKKDHVNIIFCGHVDAGKSTIGGHIMYLCGLVDKRTLEKYEKEAKEMNRESWFYAWALDTNSEERDKGITVEVGRAHFETETKRYTILDAPGHKSFVPNMISGAAQADVAILVISARKGEFETGFERGGQTREHAMLVKTAGVKHLVVLINKMDEPTVCWEEGRYAEIKKKLTPFLNSCGFKVKADASDVFFMPCSGYTGDFLKKVPDESVCPWFRGPTLLDYLDRLPGVGRQFDGPVRLPIVEKFRDMGTIVMGKLETGTVTVGTKLVVMPNKVSVEVMQIMTEEDEPQSEIRAGENTKLKLKGVEEEEISTGFILCSPQSLCHTARIFDAQIAVLDYKSIICPGWGAVMHAHTCTQEVQLRLIICLIDKKTGDKGEIKPKFIKQDQVAIVRFEVLAAAVVCLETFKDFPQLGRFTLRDEGKTVAIGKVLKIVQ